MGQWPPFFPLTSTFFGLTSEYKSILLEEIHLCTQHLKNFTHGDVLALPTYERRFHLGMLVRDVERREEHAETTNTTTNTGKGTRSTKVSGSSLKRGMQDGSIPL